MEFVKRNTAFVSSDLKWVQNNSVSDFAIPKIMKVLSTGIFKIFRPSLNILKILGNFPITEEINWKTGRVEFKFELYSKLSLFSILLTIINGLIVGILAIAHFPGQCFELLNELLGFSTLSGPKTSLGEMNSFSILIGRSVGIIVPLSSMFNVFLISWSSPSFARFIENWQDFEILYHKSFSAYREEIFASLIPFRNRLAIYYFLLLFIPNLLQLGTQTYVYTNFQSAFAIILVLWGGLPSMSMIVWEFNTVLMFRVSEEAFRQIDLGIQNTQENVSYEKVQSWMKLLNLVRSQIRLTEKTLEANEVINVLSNFWMYLATLFVFYIGFSNGRNYSMVLAGIAISLWLFCRLTFRAVIAQRIDKEEKKIAVTVQGLKCHPHDVMTRVEMKFLADTILTSSSQIQYANLITFNTGFLLRIMTSIVTYLIVLIQFDSSSKQ